jgi:hypothetical protein
MLLDLGKDAAATSVVCVPPGKRLISWSPSRKSYSDVVRDTLQNCHFLPLISRSGECLKKPHISAQTYLTIATGPFGREWQTSSKLPLGLPPVAPYDGECGTGTIF